MIAPLVSLLAMASATQLDDAPFAKGPLANASAMSAAIAKCHAPARIIESDGAALVLLASDRSQRAFDCLSAWIARHPDSGFEKFGFLGSERR